MMDELLYFNGINGDSGDYDLPPMSGEELLEFIRGEKPPENLRDLRRRYQQPKEKHLGVIEGVDVKDLAQSGWGIIFAHETDPAIKEALGELIEHRRRQANEKHEYFRLFEGGKGHRPDESKSQFLARHGAEPGPANPEKVPYYLLIVGDPQRIPYRFQTQLDVQYAVGRIYFESLDEYANYARSVVEAETGAVKLARDIALFSVANDDDRPTQLSAEKLMAPLLEHLKSEQAGDGWQVSDFFRKAARKDQLLHLLGGDQTPAVLFTASQGMQFDLGSDRQLPHQGALLCQDWPGPKKHKGAIPQDFYLAGDDLSSDANLLGLIAFLFACFGAGTPHFDDFAKQAFKGKKEEIAPRNFLAQIPLKMPGHPRGGALAVVGHVDRVWSYSFDWPGAGARTDVIESTLRRLLDEYPLGSAVENFNERYAELSTLLSDELADIDFGKKADPYELSVMWTANNDARGYTVIGDPAVRLPVVKQGEESGERPVIEVKPASDGQPATVVGLEAAAKIGVAGEHRITVTTFEESGPDGWEVAAETTLTISSGKEVSESQTTVAEDEEVQAAHRALVQEARAACQAYIDSLAPDDD